MKRIFSVTVSLVLVSLATSCKRDYTCICTAKTVKGMDSSIYTGEIHQSKNGAFHECCVLKKQGLEEQGYTDVSCAVPI